MGGNTHYLCGEYWSTNISKLFQGLLWLCFFISLQLGTATWLSLAKADEKKWCMTIPGEMSQSQYMIHHSLFHLRATAEGGGQLLMAPPSTWGSEFGWHRRVLPLTLPMKKCKWVKAFSSHQDLGIVTSVYWAYLTAAGWRVGRNWIWQRDVQSFPGEVNMWV